MADSLLFRTGWYNRFLEPDSSAGSLESHLHWLRQTPSTQTPEALVMGDSRIAEGFSAPIAARATSNRLHFRNFGLSGGTPRIWYYTLRAADPSRRRFAAIAIALDNYSDADWFAEFEDRATDQNYLVMQLSLSDCLDFSMSMHSMTMRHHAFFGCLFRGMILRDDVQAFLAHPEQRIDHAEEWRKNGLAYVDGYGGRPESLRGLSIDWKDRTAQFPDGVSEQIQANVRRFALREPVPQTGALARYRRLWLGRILDLYKDSPTRLIFLQLPRAPLVNPEAAPDPARRFVDSAHADVLPAQTFTDLERPEVFFDGLHLNRDGRQIFSARLAEQIKASLAKGRRR